MSSFCSRSQKLQISWGFWIFKSRFYFLICLDFQFSPLHMNTLLSNILLYFCYALKSPEMFVRIVSTIRVNRYRVSTLGTPFHERSVCVLFCWWLLICRLSRDCCSTFPGANIFHLNSTSYFEKTLVALVHVNIVEVLNNSG